jgi:hypothetical protein
MFFQERHDVAQVRQAPGRPALWLFGNCELEQDQILERGHANAHRPHAKHVSALDRARRQRVHGELDRRPLLAGFSAGRSPVVGVAESLLVRESSRRRSWSRGRG